MSIDKIINHLMPLTKDDFELTETNLNDHIKIHLEQGARQKPSLWVLIPPWRGRFNHSSSLTKKIMARGDSFLDYEFPTDILTSNHEKTRKYFQMIRERVVDDVEKLVADKGIDELNLIGVSLGCVNACMIANNYPNFKKVELVVPGHCLAESLWTGIRTQHLRKDFESQGIDLYGLKQEWIELAPENNLNGLANSKVVVRLSKSDRIIPYSCGAKLVERMKEKGINLRLKENRFLGHYGTAFHFYLTSTLFRN